MASGFSVSPASLRQSGGEMAATAETYEHTDEAAGNAFRRILGGRPMGVMLSGELSCLLAEAGGRKRTRTVCTSWPVPGAPWRRTYTAPRTIP